MFHKISKKKKNWFAFYYNDTFSRRAIEEKREKKNIFCILKCTSRSGILKWIHRSMKNIISLLEMTNLLNIVSHTTYDIHENYFQKVLGKDFTILWALKDQVYVLSTMEYLLSLFMLLFLLSSSTSCFITRVCVPCKITLTIRMSVI